TFPLPLVSKVAPQSRLKVQPQLSKAPQSKGLSPLFLHVLSPHPNTTLPKFPKRGILKTYKKLLERPSQFEKDHKVFLMRIIFGRFSEFKKKKSSEHNYLSEPTFRSLLRMTLLSFKIMVQKH
ncbi:MAG: hypothetical protein DBY31_01360, partial [Succinivibrio sp.]